MSYINCSNMTESEALHAMTSAFNRLKALGWQDAKYCPKDGSLFEVIEVDSVGKFQCTYQGEYPDGYFMVRDGGDVYPTCLGVVLFRPLQPASTDGQ